MFKHYTLQQDRDSTNLKLNKPEHFDYAYISAKFVHRGNSFTLTPDLELRKDAGRIEPNYLHSFEVWSLERKIGYLHTNSRLKYAEDIVKFDADNSLFYTVPGFLYYLELFQAVGLYEETKNYFEIALDVQQRSSLLQKLSYMERHSTLDVNNPAPKFRPLRKKTLCGKHHNGAMYTFGHPAKSSKGTGKQVAVYNKTDELAACEAAGKAKRHVGDFHVLNNLDPALPTERIEVRITNRWLAANGIKVTSYDLAQLEVLKTLFIRAVGDVFKFVDLTDQTKPKRNAQGNYPLPFKDLLPLGALQSVGVSLPQRLQPNEEISDNKKRVTYKTLVTQFVAVGASETAAAIIHFENTNTPPRNANWPDLRSRYAKDFVGRPTPDSKDRIANIGALLTLSIKYGEVTRNLLI